MKVKVMTDLQKINLMRRNAENAGKPLMIALRKVANEVRKDTRAHIRSTPIGGRGPRKIAEYVEYKAQPKEVRVIIYTSKLAIFFNGGTGIRKTKAGYNRGKFPHAYGWLVTSLNSRGQEVINAIKDTPILL